MLSSLQLESLRKEIIELVDKHCYVRSKFANKQAMVDTIYNIATSLLNTHYDELKMMALTNDEELYDKIMTILDSRQQDVEVRETCIGLRPQYIYALENSPDNIVRDFVYILATLL
jgi:hypothetical protein